MSGGSAVSSRGGLLRHQGIVDLLGADRRRPLGQAFPIALEDRALFDRSELHAPTDVGADIDIGGAEILAEDKIAVRQSMFERVHHMSIVAIARPSLAAGWNDKSEGFVGYGGFNGAGGE